MSDSDNDHEFLWSSGRLAQLPLLELVQEVPGHRSKPAWAELVRREECWRSQSTQLLDAKRNEERAVGERLKDRERLTKVLRLDSSHGPVPASMGFILASIDAVVRQAAGPVASLMSEPMVECETSRLRARLTTLESAIRAVRDGEYTTEVAACPWPGSPLDKLYAMVPEVGS